MKNERTNENIFQQIYILLSMDRQNSQLLIKEGFPKKMNIIYIVLLLIMLTVTLSRNFVQAIDMFMSSCTFFVFLSLIEYAFVNVMMGDIR